MRLRWRAADRGAMGRWLGIVAICLAIIMLRLVWPRQVVAALVEFGEQSDITIPAFGTAVPYPATLVIDNVPGIITEVAVTIRDLEHARPSDVEILLVGPDNSTNVVLMAVVGDNTVTDEIRIRFRDVAASSLPCNPLGTLPSGPSPVEFKPTDCGSQDFPAPAPARGGGYGTTMSVFNGQSPNGTWQLYVNDPLAGSNGRINFGWIIDIATDAPLGARVVAFEGTRYDGGQVHLHWRTSAEVNNLGFRVYRDSGGERHLITPGLVAGSALQMGGTSLATDLSYVWTDTPEAGTGEVQYWLEDVDVHGQRTQHGPIIPRGFSSPSPSAARAALLSQVGRQTPFRPAAAVGTRIMPRHLRQTADQATQRALAAKPAVKISIHDEGWYRIYQSDLVAAGFDATVDPAGLGLYLQGQEQAIQVHNAVPGRFGAGDFIEFYGIGQNTAHTDRHIYWLVVGESGGERVPVLERSAEPGGAESFLATVERRDKVIYFAGLKNGEAENFFGSAVLSEPLEQMMTLPGVDPDPLGQATLDVAVQGVGDVAHTNPDHLVQVWVNGVSVGQMVFDGQTWQVATFAFAQSVLQEGDNTITLQAQGGSTDVSLVDYLRLRYWRRYTASHDHLLFTIGAEGGQRRWEQTIQSIDGFTTPDIRVFDITDPTRARELVGLVEPDNGYAVTVYVLGPAPRTLLAVTGAQIKRPAEIRANVASRWYAGGQGADLIIVSHGAFAEAVQSLTQARQAEGLQVAVVDVEDIYDEFSYGEPSPQAVQAFLKLAWERWYPKPRFVLLVGNATYDPRDYLGHTTVNYVPTILVDTEFMETASDDGLVDFNQDGIPEMAIGRLPFRSPEMAERVVAKLVNYSRQAGNAGSQRALLVADSPDVYEFEQVTELVRQQLPGDMAVTQVRRREMGDVPAQELIQEQINAGVSLLTYAGHGSYTFWRGDLLTAASAHALVNRDRLPVVAAMTCLNAYFLDPAQESLAEALLEAETGGAIAVLASSGMTYAAGQATVLQAWVRLVFASGNEGDRPTLGEAAIQAKAATTDLDVRRTWSLLGDPSMRLAK
jgi:subtilisin-like proprotein convertase family protein